MKRTDADKIATFFLSTTCSPTTSTMSARSLTASMVWVKAGIAIGPLWKTPPEEASPMDGIVDRLRMTS